MITTSRVLACGAALAVVLTSVPAALAAPTKVAPASKPESLPDPVALLASIATAKTAAEVARDAVHTAAENAQQSATGRKQARSDVAAQHLALDKQIRTADAAYRAFASKGALAPASPKSDEALAAAINAYGEAKKTAAALLVAASANTLGEEQAMGNLSTLSGQIDAVIATVKQADDTAKSLELLAKKDETLAGRAKQARADVKAALLAAAAAKKDLGSLSRDLQFGAVATFTPRKQKNAAELAKLQAKVADVVSALADLGALQALGAAKGACDLRRVDFRNAVFPTFKLKNGKGVVRSEGNRNVNFLHATFGDLDGDNSPEAFVAVERTAGADIQAAIGHADASTNYYVFGTDTKCKLKSIGTIAGGLGGEGKLAGNAFVVGEGGNAKSYHLLNGAIVEGK